MAISTEGRIVLSGGDTGDIRVWDGETGKLRHTFTGHTDAVNDLLIVSTRNSLVRREAELHIDIPRLTSSAAMGRRRPAVPPLHRCAWAPASRI